MLPIHGASALRCTPLCMFVKDAKYCMHALPYLQVVQSLLPEMHTYWPSYKCDGNDDDCDGTFWGHEWDKHGVRSQLHSRVCLAVHVPTPSLRRHAPSATEASPTSTRSLTQPWLFATSTTSWVPSRLRVFPPVTLVTTCLTTRTPSRASTACGPKCSVTAPISLVGSCALIRASTCRTAPRTTAAVAVTMFISLR